MKVIVSLIMVTLARPLRLRNPLALPAPIGQLLRKECPAQALLPEHNTELHPRMINFGELPPLKGSKASVIAIAQAVPRGYKRGNISSDDHAIS